MQRSTRLLLLYATIFPVAVFLLLMLGSLVYVLYLSTRLADGEFGWEWSLLLAPVVLYLPFVPYSLGLTVYYVVHMIRNPRLSPKDRALWIIATLLSKGDATLYYWYQYIWREES